MSKIYVIEVGEYSDKTIMYATTDGAAAEEYVKHYNDGRTWRFARIYALEDYIPIKNLDYLHYYLYELYFNSNLECTHVFNRDCILSDFLHDGYEITDDQERELSKNGFVIRRQYNSIGEKWYQVFIVNSNEFLSEKESAALIKVAKDYLIAKLTEDF